MQEINSKIDVLGSKYIENYASMKKIILELESYFELSKNEGSKEKIKRANHILKQVDYIVNLPRLIDPKTNGI